MCKYCESIDLYNNGVTLIEGHDNIKTIMCINDGEYILKLVTSECEYISESIKRCAMCGRSLRPITYEYKDVFEYIDTLKDDPKTISAALSELKEMQMHSEYYFDVVLYLNFCLMTYS